MKTFLPPPPFQTFCFLESYKVPPMQACSSLITTSMAGVCVSSRQGYWKPVLVIVLCAVLGSFGLTESHASLWHKKLSEKAKQKVETLQRKDTQKVPLGLSIQGSTPLQGFHPLNQQKWILLKGIPEALGVQAQQRVQGLSQLTLVVTDPTWVDPLGLDRIKVLLRTQPGPVAGNRMLWRADVSSLKQEGTFQWQLLLGQKALATGSLTIDTGIYWQTLKVALQSFYYQQLGTNITLPLASLNQAKQEATLRQRIKPLHYPALWPRQYDPIAGEALLARIPEGWCVPVNSPKLTQQYTLQDCWQENASQKALEESLSWLLLAYQLNPSTHARLGIDLPLSMLETYGSKKTPEWLIVMAPAIYQLATVSNQGTSNQDASSVLSLYQSLMNPYDTLKVARLGRFQGSSLESLWQTVQTAVPQSSEEALYTFVQERFSRQTTGKVNHRMLLQQGILQGFSLLNALNQSPDGSTLSSDQFAQWQTLAALYDAITGHNAQQLSMVSGWGQDWQQQVSSKQGAIQYPHLLTQHPFTHAWQASIPGLLQPTEDTHTTLRATPQLQAQWVFFLALMNRLNEVMLTRHGVLSSERKGLFGR
ncbi:MAG: hypothetical protein ACKO37_04340 [Vampirovibrionales bacterium]